MRANKQHNGFGNDDIGGGFRSSERESMSESVTADVDQDNEDNTGIYLDPIPAIAIRKHRNTKNRLKALQIAEARLNQISSELLDLADEIRYLNPLMAEVLDTAWESTDTALEILLDNDTW